MKVMGPCVILTRQEAELAIAQGDGIHGFVNAVLDSADLALTARVQDASQILIDFKGKPLWQVADEVEHC